MTRRTPRHRHPSTLVVLAGLSALTSFARERFLLQHALGQPQLDQAVSVYAFAALIGNMLATVLALLWIDGRHLPRFVRRTEWVIFIGCALVPIAPTAGWAIALGGAVVTYDFARQRAAFGAGQTTSLLAALVAPVFTVTYWSIVGVDSLSSIMGGYAIGFLAQAVGAVWSSRGTGNRTSLAGAISRAPSIIWPLIFAALTQVNGLIDRVFLTWTGAGWAAASAFAMNTSGTLMLVVVAPLSSEAVAGRLRSQPSKRVIAGAAGLVAVGALVTPVILPLLIRGGFVEGAAYDRVLTLVILYLLAAPGAGYWLYRARALQTNSSVWQRVTVSGLIMLAVHVAIAGAGLLAGQPYLVAVGYLIGSYVGAALLYRATPLSTPDVLSSMPEIGVDPSETALVTACE